MGPETPLPLPAKFNNTEDYVESLLRFTTSSWLLQTLCGGVHILDFYTRSPDLYSTILPQSWRDWFVEKDIMDVLDLLMREDLDQFANSVEGMGKTWRGGPLPPDDLLEYIKSVKEHLLAREFPPRGSNMQLQKAAIPRHIALGMKIKKVHEVDNFTRYIDRLTSDIATSGRPPITHLVDFGSGQNYLGRALAAPPYSKRVVAVESKQHNIEGAKEMDILAKLVPKPLVMRNKKEFRANTKTSKQDRKSKAQSSKHNMNGRPSALKNEIDESNDAGPDVPSPSTTSIDPENHQNVACGKAGGATTATSNPPSFIPSVNRTTRGSPIPDKTTTTSSLQIYTEGHGSVQYVEHIIKDGDLTPVIDQILDSGRLQDNVSELNPAMKSNTIETLSSTTVLPKSTNVNAMVISLHSCGNLVHHGLRSMLLNPHISAVAMVGCCYNLVTERLGPPTYKLPTLRANHPRLEATSTAYDPHGFPMSERLATYPLPHTPLDSAAIIQNNGDAEDPPRGIRLNITARMMAVQAPQNWGRVDSDLFFTRHFYRALLQRIFLDRGVIAPPSPRTTSASAAGHTSRLASETDEGRGPGLSSDGSAAPLTIGTLRKFAYADFVSYVRAALAKLTAPNSFCAVPPSFIADKMAGLTDDDILGYESRYKHRKHELSVMWSLMAFSAGVVEAVVVVDRWLWLKEQEGVGEAWVETVFGYGLSPRNLVVVGIKKGGEEVKV